MNKRALFLVIVLGIGMLITAHYWPDFRAGMEYPFNLK
jgi:hypothetical protein